MRVVWVVAVALVAALGAPARVAAEQPRDASKIRTAADEFDAGRRDYKQGNFETAAEHFENADRDAPSAEALRLAIRSRKQAGHGARAATLAQAALRRYADNATATELARNVLAELSPKLTRMSVECNPACGLVVDDHLVFGDSAQEQIVYLDPGRHSIAAAWPGEQGQPVQVQAEAGAERKLSLHPGPASPTAGAGPPVQTATPLAGPSAQPPESERRGLSPVFFYTSAGLTLAVGGITLWSGLDTRSNPGRDRVERECVNQGDSCSVYQDARSSQRRTNILIGTTIGLAAVTGVLAFTTDWGGLATSSSTAVGKGSLSIEPSVSWTSGPALGARGRF